MKIVMVFLSTLLVVSQTLALGLDRIKTIEQGFKKENVRTIIKKPNASSTAACVGEYQIDLQTKITKFDRVTKETKETWQTIKTLNISNDGNTWEKCDE
ncbi:hypothetical protein ACLVWU_09775 [Bdellovibrio sp. HCB290]|uniref:hypothetical protein n=1 Tax=Bdellovibrio sp. HCB290 TaxID=3394356 RepID=UPI0039B5BFD3